MFALDFIFDALRNADVLVAGQIHQQPSRDGDLGGQARTLAADRILDYLHHQGLTFLQQLLDRLLFGAFVGSPDIGDVQECGARQTDFDKGRLHAGQDAADAPKINIADQTAIGSTLHQQFLHGTLLQYGDARFLRRHVDQYLFIHLGQSLGFLLRVTSAATAS